MKDVPYQNMVLSSEFDTYLKIYESTKPASENNKKTVLCDYDLCTLTDLLLPEKDR